MMKNFFLLSLFITLILTCDIAKADSDFKIEEYTTYLQKSLKTLRYKHPKEVLAERKINNISPQDLYYYPDNFYTTAIRRGGFVPIMLYNSEKFLSTLAKGQYEAKLKSWEIIKDKYNQILNDRSLIGGYNLWKNSNTAYLSIPENKKRAVYALILFKARYVRYMLDTPFAKSIKIPSEKDRIFGDCDGISYIFAGLLLNATLDGNKIFYPDQIAFDHLKIPTKYDEPGNHVRLRLHIGGKQDILFESTTGTVYGENSNPPLKFGKTLIKDAVFERTFSVSEALGYNLFGEYNIGTKILGTESMTFTRSIYLISSGNILLGQNLESQTKFIRNTAFNEVIERVNKIIEAHNKNEDLDTERFAETFNGIMKLKEDFGAERSEDIENYLTTLKEIEPEEFERLDSIQNSLK